MFPVLTTRVPRLLHALLCNLTCLDRSSPEIARVRPRARLYHEFFPKTGSRGHVADKLCRHPRQSPTGIDNHAHYTAADDNFHATGSPCTYPWPRPGRVAQPYRRRRVRVNLRAGSRNSRRDRTGLRFLARDPRSVTKSISRGMNSNNAHDLLKNHSRCPNGADNHGQLVCREPAVICCGNLLLLSEFGRQ